MSLDTRPTIDDTADDTTIYPDSDGMPMSDNTLQFQWIVTIKENLEALFADRPDVFIAGDLLWYPVRGQPEIRRAPDALVAFGRPKGYRGSYVQHREGGVAPQVVFEVLSPRNTRAEMAAKLWFYDHYGVEEYYLYDPDDNQLSGWERRDGRLRPIASLQGWTSPRLGITFVPGAPELRILRPDGDPFLTFVELAQRADAERARADAERARADAERQRAEAERQRAEAERQRASEAEQRASDAERRAAALAERLRQLGIEP